MTVVARAPAEVLLRWSAPSGSPGQRALGMGEITIGRAPTCDIVLDDAAVSRVHARVRVTAAGVSVEDGASRNGTLVNGERVAHADVHAGDRIVIGATTFELVPAMGEMPTRIAISSDGATIVEPARASATIVAPIEVRNLVAEPRNPLDELLSAPVISEHALAALGVPITVTEVLALGSGMGSFIFVDALRNSGMATSDIAVLGNEPTPYARYQRLCTNSQIPGRERLRSNSESCPDNIWGFPGYAVREMWGNLRRGDIRTTLRVLWSIFGESGIADTYTPRSGDVFMNMADEMQRIGWAQMLRLGRIRAIRKTEEGRILALAAVGEPGSGARAAISARFVHLSLGYPAIQLLPDLAEYREKTRDTIHVVNAYEPHEGIYTQLKEKGGTIVLRGRGIVASRIIQRLYEERKAGAKITVIHLHRSKLQAGRAYGKSQRKVDGDFEFQAFNWPKGCWTGPQRYALEGATPEERKGLLDLWGGTTTANRADWRRIIRDGLREGWYRAEYGIVKAVVPTDGGVRISISNTLAGGGLLGLSTNFVVDCTGLVASPDRAPVLDDLLDTYGLARNPLGRFEVTNDFEITGMRHGQSRMFAAGATTLGGPFATVDSFLGLEYASLRTVNAMVDERPRGLRRLRGFYSMRQWLRWARGVAP